jgi:hypothetical protein
MCIRPATVNSGNRGQCCADGVPWSNGLSQQEDLILEAEAVIVVALLVCRTSFLLGFDMLFGD